MEATLTPDEAAAKLWDDYLHLCGAEAYVMARYICAPPTMPMTKTPRRLPKIGRESRLTRVLRV